MLEKPVEYESRMLDINQVVELLNNASINKSPLSLARFGHSEVYISWSTYPQWIEGWKYRAYVGANDSPLKLQNELREALMTADIVGLHRSDSNLEEDRNCSKETIELLKYLQFSPENVCSAWITHELINHDGFLEWLRKQNVVLVGRRFREAVPIFSKKGIKVTNAINLEGTNDIQKVHDQLCKENNWDVALVSAGLPATILVPSLARNSGRIAIDFGHALDKMIEGIQFNFDKTAENFSKGS